MLKIRKAQMEDCGVVYEIRNDPEVRAKSFTKEAISYDSHSIWFKNSLALGSRKIFIILDENIPVGVVRFDVDDQRKEALVSINVAVSAWGKGVGSFALSEGEKLLKSEYPELKGIIAKVLVDNDASIRLFNKNSYRQKSIEFYKEVK